jgi:glycosyltransferase involved in cell wall biosynthesis
VPPLPDPPTVSVLLYVKNGAATIARALDSVVSQSYPHRQIVAVDGASTDGTYEVLTRYQSHIDVLVSEPDSGGADAANKALRLATGDIVVYVMADDWLSPGALEAIVAAFQAAPEAELVTAGVAVVKEVAPDRFETMRELPGSAISFDLPVLLDMPMGAARFWRRSTLNRLGGFDAAYPYAHDRDLMVRAWLVGVRGAAVDDVLYTYRQHPASRTLGGNRPVIRCFLSEHWRMSAGWLRAPTLSSEARRCIKAWRADQLAEATILALGDREVITALGMGLAGLAEGAFAPALARRLAARAREHLGLG